MNNPDFFIIGAPKCGTTTLYSWLKDHPDVFMPEQKEPHYFVPHLSDRYCRIRNEKDYLDLFAEAKDNKICGEASVLYSFYPQSIKRILTFNKDAKIIYMIRNPVDMAVSYHRQLLNNMEEDIKDFHAAWNQQSSRDNKLPKNSTDSDLLNYKKHCALGHQLENIINIVPSNQLLVIVLDDMANDPDISFNKVLDFLNISTDYKPEFIVENEAFTIHSINFQKLMQSQSKSVRSLKVLAKKIIPNNFIHKYNRKKINKKPVNKQLRKTLYHELKDDIVLIEKLLSRQFISWKVQE